jgi:ADP-L-glycero-D-manno-heptose 6-epimerase
LIIVTGGAGFIGSNIVKALNDAGEDKILIVDRLGKTDKWKNLSNLRFMDYEHKDDFSDKLEKGLFPNTDVWAVIHMGACSSTTELNADYLMDNNFKFSQRLAQRLAGKNGPRFIYASSAATYGAGEEGYSDNHDSIHTLRPLNMYGYSKQLFDLWALRTGFLSNAVGLKYFNVFGPNEYHKGNMRSVAIRAYFQIKDSGTVKLFKSYKAEYNDGEQLRDFIYVKDAVRMTLAFLERPEINGLYNVGTGMPRTFNDLASALFSALKLEKKIEYIEMPDGLEKRYQYFTSADLDKHKGAGLSVDCISLEESVADYAINYLSKDPRSETEN